MPVEVLWSSFPFSSSTFLPKFSLHSHITSPWLHKTKTPTRITCQCIQHRKKRFVKKSVDPEVVELVRVLVRSFNYEKTLMSTLNKYVKLIRTQHCFLLFEELGRRDKWLQCLEVFRWMQRQRWYVPNNDIFSKLISVVGRKGKTRMASWLFTEMYNSGCKPDTSVYNALITAYLYTRDKSKGLAKALSYFDKMKGMDQCQPNVVTFNILLRGFAQAKDVQHVNSLFRQLDESLITPDIFTYNGVIDAYGKNGMIGEMELIISRMRSAKCKPNIITFNSLIDAYGRRQQFDKMEQVFKSLLISSENPSHATFNSMITNYGKARLPEKAEVVVKKMKELGFSPSYITHECLIIMYGHCGYVSAAKSLYDGISVIRSSTLNAMLCAYCLNGLVFEADMLLETAIKEGIAPSSSTYKLLYKAYTRANSKELLQKLLNRMDIDRVIPDKKFFLEALGTFGSSSEPSVDHTNISHTNRSSSGRLRPPGVVIRL